MVIIGNPPYSGHSANSSWRETKEGKKVLTFIGKLVQDYYKVDGVSLGERNPKWLQDDYVKFIRFAQWRIERTGYGILAFITNHGYLDNPTFRGMRLSLMQSFDEIYSLDLHGNSKKREHAPDGTKDENVFDIQQGVAISIFVRRLGSVRNHKAVVRHAHLWGPRERYQQPSQKLCLIGGKYHWLAENDLSTTAWTKLQPRPPFYLFVPQNEDLLTEYEQGWKVTEIMPVNVLGFQTHRDYFAINFDKDYLKKRFSEMRDDDITDQEYADRYNLSDSSSWKLAKARRLIRADSMW
jgi:predicted helicase